MQRRLHCVLTFSRPGWFGPVRRFVVADIGKHGLYGANTLAVHLLPSDTDIRTVQELLDHSDVSTTMIYTHVLKVAAGGTASPLDSMAHGS